MRCAAQMTKVSFDIEENAKLVSWKLILSVVWTVSMRRCDVKDSVYLIFRRCETTNSHRIKWRLVKHENIAVNLAEK